MTKAIVALLVFALIGIEANAQAETRVVVIPMGDAEFNYANFSGPQRDLKQSLLEAGGWSICHTSTFNDTSTSITKVLIECSGSELMLACRPVDSIGGFFTLAAYAPRGDVTFSTGGDTSINTTHTANGSEWYFDNSWSWGFAPQGEPVENDQCDVRHTREDYRMCLHTVAGYITGGLRCGAASTPLNFSTTWERVVLHR